MQCSRLVQVCVLACTLFENTLPVSAFTFHTSSIDVTCNTVRRTHGSNAISSSSRAAYRHKLSYASLPNNQVETSSEQSTVANTSENQRYLHQLFLMMRPINFPIVTLFHTLGVHLSIKLWNASTTSAQQPLLMPLLKHPSMLMVLLSLLLVTSTSMITNDYYDARNGVDFPTSEERDKTHYHPLAQGLLPYSITKTFDSYLYAILLLSSAFVPGVIPRLMVLSGAIITYLYTVHLKPRTFIKNWSCAALVAMSPITSGLAAWEVLCGKYGSNTVPLTMLVQSPLIYLVVALFAGITSREILMDITDYESDARAGVQTIPVRYGTTVAANIALGWSFLCSIATCILPIIEGFHSSAKLGSSSISGLGVFMVSSARRLILSVVGSTMLLYRAFSVSRTKGQDVDLAERAVSSSLLSVLLVLASFV